MRSGRGSVRLAVAVALCLPGLAAAAPLRLSIRVHDGIVPDVAFAGRYLALAAQHEGIRLFDATTGELVRTVTVTEPIRATAIDADDIFVAAYEPSGVNRYATETGALVSSIPLGFEPSALARDGNRLLVGCPAGRGTCRAVGRVAGEDVTRSGRLRRRPRRGRELVLRLDRRGRALLASSPDGLAVDVALRVTDRAHVARTATATVVVR